MQNTMQLTAKQPAGAWVLFFVQIFSTITFAVLFSSLTLYATAKLGMGKHATTILVGSFIALNYGLHLLGGYVGGRFFSYRVLFMIGMVLQVIACIFFAAAKIELFYWACAFFLTGAGLNVTCINCLLTELYEPSDMRREKAFLWNYAGMNLGFFVGYLIAGSLQEVGNYSLLFTLSGSANALSFLIVAFNFKVLKDKDTFLSKLTSNAQKIRQAFLGVVLMIALFFGLHVLMQHDAFSNILVRVVGVAMLFVIFGLSFKESIEARKKMWCFILLALFSTLFWGLYFILPNGLTFFLNNNVDRSAFHYILPPQWFLNINPFIIVLIGPLLGIWFQHLRQKGYQITVPFQFMVALFLMAAGFLVLPLGIKFASPEGYTPMIWIIVSYTLQTFGELFISPIGYAMIGILAPARLQGLMMGTWMLMIGVGGALSGVFSSMMVGSDVTANVPLLTNPQFFHSFFILGIFMFIGAVISLMMYPYLNRLIRAV
jgi:POT family proton-dependent oligopeptide transporter